MVYACMHVSIVCTYACIYICMYVCMDVCIYCMYVRTYLCLLCLCVWMYVHIVCIYVCMHIYVCMRANLNFAAAPLFFLLSMTDAMVSSSTSSLPSLPERAVEEIADRLSVLPDLTLPFSLSQDGNSSISQADKKAHLLDLLHREAAIFLGTFSSTKTRRPVL